MTYLALAFALVLQLTGIWPHLSSQAHSDIARAANPRVQVLPPVPMNALSVPVLTAKIPLALKPSASVYAFDRATAMPLYSQNIDQKRPIASITKLITAIVILDRHKPTDKVTIGKLPEYVTADETLGLREGEVYTVGDLVTAALVPSDNDAADALAIYDSGSVSAFADRMNAKIAQWHISGTHFSNPTGLVDDGNYTTARALGQIGILALQQPFIAAVVKLPTANVSSADGRTFNLTNTNTLLATGYFYGIKTGYTEASGECFIGISNVNGHQVVTVLLGADDRFGDTQELVNWIGQSWQWL
jgi:D-alanyl-D-alanine carboxypeptidase